MACPGYDLSPNTWGHAPSGIGVGSVIDQGWQKDLERRGWEFPVFSGGPDIRDQEMKRLSTMLQRPKEGLVDQLIPAPPVTEAHPPYKRDPKHDPHLPPEAQAVIDQQWPEESAQQLVANLLERSQHEIGTELEKEHFSHGKPKDKTPGEVADTHLGENPRYYPASKRPRGSKEALRWVK